MSNSRNQILADIRRTKLSEAPLPDHSGPWIRYEDPLAQFGVTLASIGGVFHRVDRRTDILPILESMPIYQQGKRKVSLVEEVPGERSLGDDPHTLEDVWLAVLPGEFGVAENAAIWTTDRHVSQRAIYFLCEHLVLVIPASEIVHNMHEAYERVRFDSAYFGAFIAGPSKTADIEQSLVIGAHGPRSLTVFAVEQAGQPG